MRSPEGQGKLGTKSFLSGYCPFKITRSSLWFGASSALKRRQHLREDSEIPFPTGCLHTASVQNRTVSVALLEVRSPIPENLGTQFISDLGHLGEGAYEN